MLHDYFFYLRYFLNKSGIGIVTENLFQSLLSEKVKSLEDVKSGKSLFVKVKWIIKDEFEINITNSEGKLTNIRAATCYEEFLPMFSKR